MCMGAVDCGESSPASCSRLTRLTTEAIGAGVAAQPILDAMTEAMTEVGRRLRAASVYVPEMLIAARAMKESTALLVPLLVAAASSPSTRSSYGPLRGTSTTSARTSWAMCEGANLAVVDLGTNVPPERFAAVRTAPASWASARCSRPRGRHAGHRDALHAEAPGVPIIVVARR